MHWLLNHKLFWVRRFAFIYVVWSDLGCWSFYTQPVCLLFTISSWNFFFVFLFQFHCHCALLVKSYFLLLLITSSIVTSLMNQDSTTSLLRSQKAPFLLNKGWPKLILAFTVEPGPTNNCGAPIPVNNCVTIEKLDSFTYFSASSLIIHVSSCYCCIFILLLNKDSFIIITISILF